MKVFEAPIGGLQRICTVVLLFAVGCASHDAVKKTTERMDLGWVERTALSIPENRWFDSSYAAYNPALELLEDLQTQLDSVEFLVVFGTWCKDTHRELPRFFKIADGLGIPNERIRLYGVDRSKIHPEGIPQQYEIKNVPTIIVTLRERELGRIVEKPRSTLEQDLLEIFLALIH